MDRGQLKGANLHNNEDEDDDDDWHEMCSQCQIYRPKILNTLVNLQGT